jgi:NADH-quinone oxidoreductase subunit J
VVLLAELVYLLASNGLPGAAGDAPGTQGAVEAKAVGVALFGPYLLGVELASILLLAGLVATHRLTREDPELEDAGEGED